jgi:diguanylate cyclase (GGDEF)-like protein
MNDRLLDLSNSDALMAEVERLRSEIAELEQRVAALDQLAHQDSLIELPNRRGFMRQLERLISRVERYGEPAAMLFVDIDGLKGINDGHGHKAGDEALIHVADLLVGGVRKCDCVARLGGDEFGVLLERSDEESANETAARIAQRIAADLFEFESARLPISVAIGVGMIQPGDDPSSVIARADKAMYRIKSAA